MIPPSSLVISQGWGLIDLPLRASNEGLLRPRVAWHRRPTGYPVYPFYGAKSSASRARTCALVASSILPTRLINRVLSTVLI